MNSMFSMFNPELKNPVRVGQILLATILPKRLALFIRIDHAHGNPRFSRGPSVNARVNAKNCVTSWKARRHDFLKHAQSVYRDETGSM